MNSDRLVLQPQLEREQALRRTRRRLRQALRQALVYVILLSGAALVLLPFVWMISTALKSSSQVFAFPPIWFPRPLQWSNFPEALTVYPFGLWVRNTLFITLCATAGTVLSTSMAAFAFARLRWPGRDVCFLLVLATLMLPDQVTLIPTFVLFRTLGWVNTWLPLIVPAWLGRQAFYIFMLRQFFMTVPLELDDAARVDGAGVWTLYSRIVMPLSTSALAIVAILFFQNKWDEFLAPLIYLHDTEKFTIAVGLRLFQGGDYGTDWNLMMAAATTFILPVLALFFFAQRYFVQGIVFTGIKG